MKHELKADAGVFEASFRWKKNYEIRKDDREGGFNIGDELLLRETQYTGEEMRVSGAPLIYTGREITRAVAHILRGPAYGIPEGFAILGWTI